MEWQRAPLRLFAVGLGIPLVLIVSDEWLIAWASAGNSKGLWVALFVWLVAQTALMSFAAGKWLPNWRWRLIVLTWTLLLLNILRFHASAFGNWLWQLDLVLLAYAFIAAQFSLAAAWLVLGAGRWQWRLPSTAIVILPAGLVIAEMRSAGLSLGYEVVWKEVAALEVIATILFALVLCIRGYRVERIEPTHPAQAGHGDSSSTQFSLVHMLVWTAAVAPILVLLKAIDYAFPLRYGWRQWGLLAADGLLLAPVVLMALWAALGTGRAWLKVVCLTAVAAVTGFTLRWFEEHLGSTPGGLAKGAIGTYVWLGGKSFVIRFTDAGLGWIAWTELSGFLLSGMLLVFRVTAYRLVRRRRISAAT